MRQTSQNRRPLRFIPFRRMDVLDMLLREDKLDSSDRASFTELVRLLQSIYHFEYHEKLEALKNAYAPLNPDRDTIILPGQEAAPTTEVSQQLELLLDKANYELLSRADLEKAFTESSLFKLQLHIDVSEFEQALVFTRGEQIRHEEIRSWFGLRRKSVEFVNFDRVVLYIQYKGKSEHEAGETLTPRGSVLLKLFQNVPKADIEMLFPNTRLGMRPLDKLVIGIPAVAGGIAMFTTKVGASLLLLGALLGYWLGLRSEPVQLTQTTLLALVAGLGGLGSFLWKQFSNFRNRKLSFMQSLTENLYFRNLDNNAGVFSRLIDDAEEEECKEAMIAYYFLLTRRHIDNAAQLDQEVEEWFEKHWSCTLDFEVGDALAKLVELELVQDSHPLQSEDLDRSRQILRRRWDAYF